MCVKCCVHQYKRHESRKAKISKGCPRTPGARVSKCVSHVVIIIHVHKLVQIYLYIEKKITHKRRRRFDNPKLP